MIGLTAPSWVANGNISPCRFVTPSSTNQGKCVQTTAATQLPVGISGEYTRNQPGSAADDGYAAVAGEEVNVHPPGTICNLTLGGTVGTNALIVSHTDGTGVAWASSTTAQWIAAMCIVGGVAGDKVPVWMLPPNQYQANS